MDRIKPLLGKMTGSPTTNMKRLLEKLSPSDIVPQVNKYYVFVYDAKTPRIRYDQHPFVLVSSIWKWGFIGYNFHWDDHRRYTWQEVASNIYEIYDEELNTMEKLPIAYFKNNP